MRFGIIAMQVNALIPPGLATQETYQRLADFDQVEVVRGLVSQGFNLIEIGIDLGIFLPHTFDIGAIENLASLIEELGVTYTVHLPLWSVEPSTPLETVRDGSVQALIDAIQRTQPLNPEIYILHATGALAAEFYRMNMPDAAKKFSLQQFQNCAEESIKSILAETGLPSRKIAVETIEFPFEMTLDIAEKIDLSICFDTGHVILGFSGQVNLYDALEASLPRLGEVHLHDGATQGPEQKIGYSKDHQALGKGELDVNRFLNILLESNFEGPIIFELSAQEAIESMEYIRKIRPDFID
jgi:sugar phosphate isomerase/epimerase